MLTGNIVKNIMAQRQKALNKWSHLFPVRCHTHSYLSTRQLRWQRIVFPAQAERNCSLAVSQALAREEYLQQHTAGVDPREEGGWSHQKYVLKLIPARGDPLPHPAFHWGLFVTAALSFPPFWHAEIKLKVRVEFQLTSGLSLVLHNLKSKTPRRKLMLYVDQLQSHLLHR